MKKKFALIALITFLLSVAFVPSVPAQSSEEVAVVIVDPDTDLELEILENDIAQLRRRLRLSRMRDVQKTKEWRQNYQQVKQDIKKWNEFADKYAIQE